MTDGREQPVIREDADGVALIILNRPAARNALNEALVVSLRATLEAADGDPAVGAIVLTGAGTAFCAGADLKEMARAADRADVLASRRRADASMALHQALPRLGKPVIAAVNGPAVAGGCGLAMSCDLVIASDRATFGYPEVVRGQVAALVMVTLARIVGRRAALDLLLTGRTIDAPEALAIGLINRVVDHDEALGQARDLAAQIAGHSASATQMTKELFYRVIDTNLASALAVARDVNVLMRFTKDSREGAHAFSDGPSTATVAPR